MLTCLRAAWTTLSTAAQPQTTGPAPGGHRLPTPSFLGEVNPPTAPTGVPSNPECGVLPSS